MAITSVIQFGSLTNNPSDTLTTAIPSLKATPSPENFVLGTGIQAPTLIQGTAEWTSAQDSSTFQPSPAYISALRTAFGPPTRMFHASMNRPALGPGGPATGAVTEYVLSYFPVSKVTPEFQAKIEADFARFEHMLFDTPVEGNIGPLAKGWVVEELDHAEIKGEKARGFFVINGWNSLQDFENLLKTPAFAEAIPILMAWSVPVDLWHVESKVNENYEYLG